ncbi:bifunctional acetaldehyde-CoA/alcohol dehydrogenase [Persicobacter psychrovividus]|uniref:Aldehyde-alcohol dehydrogenase n=1 Tax=Persicobacter psychrovividus TaxID=387638 RepID=A0ABM7VER3_9BACT|nr:aldehyde-alcohol dehydrogenase [Persicobacter psychrovividus]
MSSIKNLIAGVRKAQTEYSDFTQEQVDEIFHQAALAANNARIPLAKQAVAETGMGIVEDKVIKNHFASEFIYNKYKETVTCGIIEEDEAGGIIKIARPVGIIAGIVPTTNPTSTAIFKALMALKTRNGIIFSPHPRAKDCTIAAAKVVLDAAVAAGAPEGIIGWIDEPSVDKSSELMSSVDLILATGGPGMVKAAYSSGVPAIGVGAGNTPVIIDDSCHIKMAVNSVLVSKSFDNGVICASEQAVVVDAKIYDEVRAEFAAMGAHICTPEQVEKMRKTILVETKKGTCALNADIVGQSAQRIAELAGFEVPVGTKALIGEVESVEFDEPFAHEKLSPVLAMYKSKNFDDALAKADRLVVQGGLGHTSVLYADQAEHEKIEKFQNLMKTGRTLINMPAAQGAIGDIYNFKLAPSLTLGCGSWGGNAVSENVGPTHLLNIKTVAQRRENMLWFRIPEKVYFKFGSLQLALQELHDEGKKRVFIVTDRGLAGLGYTDFITKSLEANNIDYRIFSEVDADPVLSVVRQGAEQMTAYQPDYVIALGGGSAMDAAKIMWVMYEHPEVEFSKLAMTFMDIRKRIAKFPKMGSKAQFMAVATSSGTGSEVTPFSVITDDATGVKYPLADYELTPNVAVIDPELVMSMPKGLTVASGIDVMTHALEALVSVMASDYTNPLALEAARLVFKYLPLSVEGGSSDLKAKEKMANAAAMAGMAFANAFLGVCHSMAHKLGAAFHIPHGIANALMLNEVIRFNSVSSPRKMTAFPQYKYPNAAFRYARAADHCGLGGKNEEEKVQNLIQAISDLNAKIGVPATIQEWGVSEALFLEKLDTLVEEAFDDQCTGANPRYPLMEEIREMLLRAYYGPKAYEAKQAEEAKAAKPAKKAAKK